MQTEKHTTTGESPMEIQFHVSLRDYFAAAALTGLLAARHVPLTIENLSESAFSLADGMLKERKKESK